MFGSYYWEHIVTELRSQARLASRGAVLFNNITHKRIEEDRSREDETVTKITRSLTRIREQQLKVNVPTVRPAAAFVEASEHFEG
jgi:pimeloyl-CoA synthetase